jgi:hypothetical protein
MLSNLFKVNLGRFFFNQCGKKLFKKISVSLPELGLPILAFTTKGRMVILPQSKSDNCNHQPKLSVELY